eukprot:scaffold194140_cov35-Tisochrysis_lutea.AAC.1
MRCRMWTSRSTHVLHLVKKRETAAVRAQRAACSAFPLAAHLRDAPQFVAGRGRAGTLLHSVTPFVASPAAHADVAAFHRAGATASNCRQRQRSRERPMVQQHWSPNGPESVGYWVLHVSRRVSYGSVQGQAGDEPHRIPAFGSSTRKCRLAHHCC